jgi:predicted nucleic acid-binding protein
VTVFLADSNVLIDIATNDAAWADWSLRQLDAASASGCVVVNPVIYAELSVAYQKIEALEAVLSALKLEMLEIPRPALFLAARVFRDYRRSGGQCASVLPEFFVGAHAAVERMTLITRDARRRRWFPTVRIIAPHI